MKRARFLLLTSALLSACGGEEPLDETVAEDSIVPDTCEPSMLAWDDPASTTTECDGPWEYSQYKTCTKRAPECGAQECVERECASYRFGIDGAMEMDISIPTPPFLVPNIPCTAGPSLCPKPPVYPNVTAAQAECNTRANALRNQWLTQLRAQGLRPQDEAALRFVPLLPPLPGQPPVQPVFISAYNNGFWGTCNLRLSIPNPKVGRSRVDGANICPSTATCTAHDYPLCTFTGASCGTFADSAYSAPHLTRAQLSASDHSIASTPVCTTCDPLPIQTPADARSKLACIEGRLAGPMNEATVDPTVHDTLVKKAMLLYELRGDAFTPSERARLRSRYGGAPADPGCAPTAALEPPASCLGARNSYQGVVEIPAPPSVVEDALRSSTEIRAFKERSYVTLTNKLVVDASSGSCTGEACPGAKILPGIVDTYLIHLDPYPTASAPSTALSGSITFGSDILGVIVNEEILSLTDSWLGAPGTTYPIGWQTRGLENDDSIEISADQRTLNVNLNDIAKEDQIRVVVAASLTPAAALANDALRCQRLSLPHVPAEVAFVEGESCYAALYTGLELSDAGLDASCDGSAVRQNALAFAEAITIHGFGVLDEATNPFGGLARTMEQLDKWYLITSDTEQLETGSYANARPALGRVLGRFWRQVYDAGGTTEDLITSPDLDTALLTSSSRAMAVDREVLRALFTAVTTLPAVTIDGQVVMPADGIGGIPITDQDLILSIAGAGTQSLVTRLRDLGLFHDFARRFSGQGPIETEVSTLWAMLAALSDPTQLQAAIDISGDNSGWRPVFAQIRANHFPLFTSLRSSSPLGHAIRAHVQEAQERRASYLATGFLDPNRRNTLHASLDQKIRSNVITFMQAAATDLDDELSDYEADLAVVVNGLVSQAGTQAALDRIANLRLQRADDIDNLRIDLGGLMLNAAREEARFADIVDAFEAVERAIDGGQFVTLPESELFELSGADARFNTPVTTITQLSAHAFTGLNSGEILSVRTTGRWSPTCAVSSVRIIDPNGVSGGITVANPEVGPEGFTLSYRSNSYHADSYSTVDAQQSSSSYGINTEICAGGPLSEVGFSAKACAVASLSWSTSHTNSHSNSSGGGSETSAAFTGGLRLPNTPFPLFPAGALIAVVMPAGVTNPALMADAYVVREGGTAVMIPGPADVHLVVNDLAVCPNLNSTNRLTVTTQKLISATALARAVVGTMGTQLAELRARIPMLAAQGTVLPSQTAQIRSEAVNDVEIASGVPFNSLPSPLLGLFNAFLDSELVRLERAVQIQTILRRMEGIGLELQAMDDDVQNLGVESRLAQILPSLAVRNLDGDRLRVKSNRLVDVSLQFLHPIMDLWYPDALAAMNADVSIQNLLDATAETRLIDLVGDVQAVVDDALLEYQVAELGYQEWQQRPVVAVSFVRPDFVPGPFDPASPWRKADPLRARSVWDAIAADSMATFTIDVNDVYSALGGDGVIGCLESVPVIHRMALFVARPNQTNNEDLNGRGRWFPGSAAEADVFVRADGNTTYFLDDGLGQGLSIPILHGEPDEALELFHSLARPERLVGLSPFTDFQVNFAGLPALRVGSGNEDGFRQIDPFTGEENFVATEVMLVMELDSRGVGVPMPGVDVCRP